MSEQTGRSPIPVMQFRDDYLPEALHAAAVWIDERDINVWDVTTSERPNGQWLVSVYYYQNTEAHQ